MQIEHVGIMTKFKDVPIAELFRHDGKYYFKTMWLQFPNGSEVNAINIANSKCRYFDNDCLVTQCRAKIVIED